MNIKNALANLMAHFAPLALVKRIYPGQETSQVFTCPTLQQKPWIDVDSIELTQEDFA